MLRFATVAPVPPMLSLREARTTSCGDGVGAAAEKYYFSQSSNKNS